MRAGFCLKSQGQIQIKGPLIRPSGTFSRKREKGVVQAFLGRPKAKGKGKAKAKAKAKAG